MKSKLLVIGHGRHGKDTVCEILRDKYDYSFESSSQFCSKLFIYDQLKDKYMSLEQWMSDFTIDNNGTLEDLEFNVQQLMNNIDPHSVKDDL